MAFENVWSILNFGLVNAAQISPDLARTGSLFGRGIYLSSDPGYAKTFAKTSPPLPGGLGRWNCLLLCEVAPGPLVTVGDNGSNVADVATATLAARDAHDVPAGVIVVEDSNSVVVRSALFWRRDSGEKEGGGICSPAVQIAVAVLLVVAAVLRASIVVPAPYRRF
eukprot:TRINITY_DN24053_c0_g1_i2.p2 TRINITY_DN24053_c0_g1~~TRINITY_DN24053_c0_g1_i2.p2  ORF type:complete len:166 (-),score=9.58 TRINITY_DN24053_c0_g1_i2:118-615(-)